MSHKLIQSYVKDSYFVSTIYRRSSTELPIWYYETMAWRWDKKTREREEHFLLQEDSGRNESVALENHIKICRELAEREVA